MNTTPPRDLLDKLSLLEAAERLGVDFSADADGTIHVVADDPAVLRFLRLRQRDIAEVYWAWRACRTLNAIEAVVGEDIARRLHDRFNTTAATEGHEGALGELTAIATHMDLPILLRADI